MVRQALWTLERLGFKVKAGKNARLDTYDTPQARKRAADINALVADDEVKMLLFGGGAAEIYIKRNRVL